MRMSCRLDTTIELQQVKRYGDGQAESFCGRWCVACNKDVSRNFAQHATVCPCSQGRLCAVRSPVFFNQSRVQKTSPPAAPAISERECQPLMDELQVHQIGLEMQNEELRITQEHLSNSLKKMQVFFNLRRSSTSPRTKKGD